MSLVSKYNIRTKSPVLKTSIFFNLDNISRNTDLYSILSSESEYDVFPEDEDDESYKEISDTIVRFVRNSGFLCRGKVNPRYVERSLTVADAIVVLGDNTPLVPNGNIFGFATILFYESQNQIYIDVICSHSGVQGAGEHLLLSVENIGRKLLFHEVSLRSLTQVIPFYEKYGYRKTVTGCDNECPMVKSIRTTRGGAKSRFHRHKAKRTHTHTHKKRRKK